jgi:endonuclease/exonuclease/phosphatase (EEP) superfamily protein YafD
MTWLSVWRRTMWLATTLLVVAGVIGLFGRSCWACELFTHFPAQFALVELAVAGGFALVGSRRAAIVPIALAAWHGAALAPFYAKPVYAKPVVAAPGGRVLRAIAVNVAAQNRDRGAVIRVLRAAKPDVVLITELTPFWAAALGELSGDLPFQRLAPRAGAYGIGLWSRLPFTVVDDIPAGASFMAVRLAEPPVTVLGAHAFPPFTPHLLRLRDQEFARIAAFVRGQPGPLVLLGDLNSSSWSPAFRDLLRDSGLRDTRLGWGLQPTWPAWLPVAQIAIDHALVSREVRVHARWVGERLGSDHLPIVLDFSLARPPSPSAR